MTTKRKIHVDEIQRYKASWTDLKVNEIFIQACMDQVTKGERIGTSFTKTGWKNIVSQFNGSSGRNYDKTKLKNRYDSLRKEWRAWFNLFGKVTGMGWDSEKNSFDAPDEWWEKKQLEYPLYGKFREKGLPFANQLTTLFKDVVANGEYAWAPSSGILPDEDCGNDVDDLGPCPNNIGLDVEEGSGDSEDVSIGATEDFSNINLNTSQGVASQSSGQKRKRASGVEKKTKKKITPSSTIAEAVSVIAETCKARNDAITSTSIGEVMATLHTMDEITSDIDLLTKCCQLMMFKPAREMFVSFKGFEDRRVHWLKFAANNPMSFMKM
ncbi:unnamed protein product [Lathyrus oleraceus]|uniref:L10-interacting MYB domain-containing protein-like isoform X1 n=1 Tax=Pisum sativum TaxID=3888 RepID=UPI0021CF7A9F|nr:L10-interacting MYB domain-containing protein-like isoform X1 [Pisum sativum]XP_050918273.1 L10-interacting MYB domain-containing protein-like isoform X1 [Pisum sativum]